MRLVLDLTYIQNCHLPVVDIVQVPFGACDFPSLVSEDGYAPALRKRG